MKHLVGYLFALLVFVIGATLAVVAAHRYVQGLRTFSWKPIAAEILQSEVLVADLPKGKRYRWGLKYHYEVDGQRFEADRAQMGDNRRGSAVEVHQLVKRFPVGTRVEVSVDPQNSRHVVLIAGPLPRLKWQVLAGIFVMLFAIVIAKGIRLSQVAKQEPQRPGRSEYSIGIWKARFLRFVSVSFFILPGLGLMLYFGQALFQGISSRGWPTVAATVIDADLVVQVDEELGDTYHPKVVYQFHLDGRDYIRDRIWFNAQGFGSLQEARTFLKDYRVGDTITVHYQASTPVQAVILPGQSLGHWMGVFFGAVFTMVGAGAVLHARRQILAHNSKSIAP